MIAASDLFVQISADRIASATSNFGGMIENPMKYDLVPDDVDGTSGWRCSGSRWAGAHEMQMAKIQTRGAREVIGREENYKLKTTSY
jgi:hypothetical protein